MDSQKTKASISILGDAFIDISCHLHDKHNEPSANNDGDEEGGVVLVVGGDTRLNRPIQMTAGGSGTNTATYLSFFIKNFENDAQNKDDEDETSQETESDDDAAPPNNSDGDNSPPNNEEDLTDVTFQSAFNESEYYGQLLMEQATQCGFKLINCQSTSTKPLSSKTVTPTDDECKDQDHHSMQSSTPSSTGHCMALLDPSSGTVERTTFTHLGTLQTFKASHTVLHELTNIHSLNPSFQIHHHHIHVSGFYNLPKFQNGSLRKRLKLIRETRRARCNSDHILTTTSSLAPRYDTTEEWDGGLLKVLPQVDFLILSLLEAVNILHLKGINVEEYTVKDGPLTQAMLFLQLANLFAQYSSQSFIIITIGKKGAVALHNGHIVSMAEPPIVLDEDSIVDSTGAGDAFCSGFLFAAMKWRKEQNYADCGEIGSSRDGVKMESWLRAVKEGMKWGVVAGTAACLKQGASTVSTPKEIKHLMSQVKDYGLEKYRRRCRT